MTPFVLAAFCIFTAPSWAVTAPPPDEVARLQQNITEAYAADVELRKTEASLRRETHADIGEIGWEDRLDGKSLLKLQLARTRSGAAWNTIIEQEFEDYELLPLDPRGHPIYPELEMQSGEAKGKKRTWAVSFGAPPEGSVTDHNGKTLRGDEYRAFLNKYNGMTSPDGTTVVWGQKFAEHPADLALVLYHELAHYELYAKREWMEKATSGDREVEAYTRSKSIIDQLGFPPEIARRELALQENLILVFSAEAISEKRQLDHRTWWEKAVDKGRGLFGMPALPRDPGYSVSGGYAIKPEVLREIRERSERLHDQAQAEQENRDNDEQRFMRGLLEDAQRRQRLEEADSRAAAGLRRLAERACRETGPGSSDVFFNDWHSWRNEFFLALKKDGAIIDFSKTSIPMNCVSYFENQVMFQRRLLDEKTYLDLDFFWASERVKEGRLRENPGAPPVIPSAPIVQTPIQQPQPPGPAAPPTFIDPPEPRGRGRMPGPEPCLGGSTCGPVTPGR